MGRILGLDVGSRRVGVAISDPLRLTAQPGPTLNRNPESCFLESLARLIDEWGVTEVAVGLPVGLRGQKGSTYEDVLRLLGKFRATWPEISWVPWEERFTTAEAARLLRQAPRKKRESKGKRDRIAAQLILQSYLASIQRKSEGGD